MSKVIALIVAVAVYVGGYFLFYGAVPGVFMDGGLNWIGMLIVVVLWSLFHFIFSGAYKKVAEEGAGNP